MFAGKVVLITGASSGIGAATAIHFAMKGASLTLTGRNSHNLQNVAQKCQEQSKVKPLRVVGDITLENDVANILNATINTFGKLDVLINNAGIFHLGSIDDTKVEQYDKIFATNVRSTYMLTHLAVPYLTATKGNIINVSSLAGLRSFSGILPYCMSKAALDQFTRCVALELAPKQIRVNSVNPGVIITDIFRRAGMSEKEYEEMIESSKAVHPLGRVGQPEEVARAIAFLASDEAAFTTGQMLCVDGGRNIACPK